MNDHIRSRIEAIQDALLAAYCGGTGMPSAKVGGERELVLRGLLREVLPSIYRFGQGAITDATGAQLHDEVQLTRVLTPSRSVMATRYPVSIDALASIAATPLALGNLCNTALRKAHELRERKVVKGILSAAGLVESGSEPRVRAISRTAK